MSTLLAGILAENEPGIVARVEAAWRAADLRHYRELEGAQLQTRVRRLFREFAAAVTGQPESFAAYLETVARDRSAEGFELREIQVALQVFEEAIWRVVTGEVPRDEQIDGLARVTWIVGVAKDRLAQTYLDLLEKAEAAIDAQRGHADRLAGGTDSSPLTEEDRIGVPRLRRSFAVSHASGRFAPAPSVGRIREEF